MEGPFEQDIDYPVITSDERKITLPAIIDSSVGKSIEDHNTPPTDNEGISKEIVNDALNDVG